MFEFISAPLRKRASRSSDSCKLPEYEGAIKMTPYGRPMSPAMVYVLVGVLGKSITCTRLSLLCRLNAKMSVCGHTNKILYFIGKDPIKTYTICNVAARKAYKYICFYDMQKRCKNGGRKRKHVNT